MNVELLVKVQEAILAEPRAFNMSYYEAPPDLVELQNPPCGSVHCIAGKAVLLSGMSRAHGINCFSGEEALDLDHYEAQRMFYASGWPDQFREPYYEAMGFSTGQKPEKPADLAKAAKIAAERIDHFIATGGKE